METIFHINTNDLNANFLHSLKSNFRKDEELTIIVKGEIAEKKPINGEEIFKNLEALKKKYGVKKISPDVNISELANEVNDPL